VRLRSQGLTAAIAAVLLLALPAVGQDGHSTITFDGVGFTFDRELGASVNVTRAPRQAPDQVTIETPDARHLVFTLYGQRPEFAKVPRVGDASGVVRVYRTADLAGYELASDRLEQLQTMLADRPDLAGFMVVNEDGFGDELPFLPVPGAGQILRARAEYIDTPEVSGIAYVLAFGQDLYPMTTDDFWYTFQGLSTDGTRLISVLFIVDASMFPDRIGTKAANRILERWVPYVTESTATLNAASPSAFSPSLTSLDALVRSITFDEVPASTSTPSGAPAPSPLPTAAG
jgi:hypothetical protein